MFDFHPYLEKWSNLTSIYQMGRNHQLVIFESPKKVACLETILSFRGGQRPIFKGQLWVSGKHTWTNPGDHTWKFHSDVKKRLLMFGSFRQNGTLELEVLDSYNMFKRGEKKSLLMRQWRSYKHIVNLDQWSQVSDLTSLLLLLWHAVTSVQMFFKCLPTVILYMYVIYSVYL